MIARVRWGGGAALAGALLALPAAAALPPCAYDALVAEAVLVVQIEVDDVGDGDRLCLVEGRVLSVLRGEAEIGAMIAVPVTCRLGEEVGPTVATPRDVLTGAAVLELHLDEDGGPAGHGAGVVALDAPTETAAYRPYCTSE